MGWRDCIVVYLDLVGLKARAMRPNAEGSSAMREFHAVLVRELNRGLESLDHVYVWNDSALLLAYVEESSGAYQACLQDADTLKRKVDRIAKSYAIAVKGQTFPPLNSAADSRKGQKKRVTILRTSSYAMANCFQIEREVKERKLRNSWYIDSRIVTQINVLKPHAAFKLKLLPSQRLRSIHSFDGYLWNG